MRAVALAAGQVGFAPNAVPVGMKKRTIWTRYYTPLEFYEAFERESS